MIHTLVLIKSLICFGTFLQLYLSLYIYTIIKRFTLKNKEAEGEGGGEGGIKVRIRLFINYRDLVLIHCIYVAPGLLFIGRTRSNHSVSSS